MNLSSWYTPEMLANMKRDAQRNSARASSGTILALLALIEELRKGT
mgnify:CR=1 FL=1